MAIFDRNEGEQAGTTRLGSLRPGSGDLGSRAETQYVDPLFLYILGTTATVLLIMLTIAVRSGSVDYEVVKQMAVVFLAGQGVAFFAFAVRLVRVGHPIQVLQPWGGLGMNPGRPRLSAPIPFLIAAIFIFGIGAVLLLADDVDPNNSETGSQVTGAGEDDDGLDGLIEPDGSDPPSALRLESESIDQLAVAASIFLENYDPALLAVLDSCIVWPESRKLRFVFNQTAFADQEGSDTNMEILEGIVASLKGFDFERGFLTITGFTDPVGDHEFNFNLSQRRADRVADLFACIADGGTDCETMYPSTGIDAGNGISSPVFADEGIRIHTIGRGEGFEVRYDGRPDEERRGVEILYCIEDGESG